MKAIVSIIIAISFNYYTFSQAPFYQKGKYGVKDASGQVILKATYDYISDYENGYARVEKKKKYGLVDSQGMITIEPAYDYVFAIKGHQLYDISVVKPGIYANSRKHGLATPTGQILLEPIYDNRVSFDPTYHVSKISNQYGEGLVDASGRVVIPVQYSDITLIGNLVRVQKSAGFGLSDLQGNMLIPIEYTSLIKFNEGLWGAIKKENIEYFNNKGKKTSPNIYEKGQYFSEGYAAVKRNGKYGFINSSGKEVIACEYDTVYAFKDGKSRGIKKGKSFTFSIPEQKQISSNENIDEFAMINMEDIESLIKNSPEFKSLLGSNAMFNTGMLQSLERKAISTGTYGDESKSVQGNLGVKRQLRTENKTSGEHFQYMVDSKIKSELFFDDSKQFCYYNTLFSKEEMAAAVNDLKEKGFSLQSTNQARNSTDTWKKDGYPFTIVMQYEWDKANATVAILANSFLKKSSIK